MVAAVMAQRGIRVLYLGASTPLEQIAAAARSSGVEAVAVSVSAGTHRVRAAKAIAVLRAALPRRMPLWIGGAGAPAVAKGVERFQTLAALDARLADWA
jgi:methylmalonyl-CoA mutase cobalamin-binding subunit